MAIRNPKIWEKGEDECWESRMNQKGIEWENKQWKRIGNIDKMREHEGKIHNSKLEKGRKGKWENLIFSRKWGG